MRAWCPRCDAVRPGETACPVCGTPLATLEDAAPAGDHPPEPPPPTEAPGPPPRSRRWIALAAATVVVAALAFVTGRSVARPAAPAATAAPATSTTAPEPGANQRELGWTARAGGLTVTAVEASRVATERRETVASISFRVQGVPADQRVLGLRGLRLLDSGGGCTPASSSGSSAARAASRSGSSTATPASTGSSPGPPPAVVAGPDRADRRGGGPGPRPDDRPGHLGALAGRPADAGHRPRRRRRRAAGARPGSRSRSTSSSG